ncbi:MAG: hypothetical protein AAGF25_01810 [Pseudomonadota bacterium]
MFRLLAALALTLSISVEAQAQSVEVIPTEGEVTAITQTPAGSYVETTRGTFAITEGSECAGKICLTPDVVRGLPERAPEGALPDGFISAARDGDIRKAWYARPTERYAHAVLGDAIEGGSLVVELNDGTQKEFVLPENQVFEDITPRIHDLNFSGTNEVVTIRSSQTGGAAVVVYGLVDGELAEVAASSENGLRNRWLNIVGVLPQKSSSSSSIYFIRTPHINGRLNRLEVGRDGSKDVDLRQNDFSNHVIGSRVLDLGLLHAGDQPHMYIPSQNRRSLRQVFNEPADISLPGKINQSLIVLDSGLLTATDQGELLLIIE